MTTKSTQKLESAIKSNATNLLKNLLNIPCMYNSIPQPQQDHVAELPRVPNQQDTINIPPQRVETNPEHFNLGDHHFQNLLRQRVQVPPKIIPKSPFLHIDLGGLNLAQLHPEWVAHHIFDEQDKK